MTDRTYAALAKYAVGQSEQHRSVVLDATFASCQRRHRLRQILSRKESHTASSKYKPTTATLKRRLAARAHSAGEISDARLEDFSMLERSYERPTEIAAEDFIAVKTARTSEAVTIATLKRLAQRRARCVG